jgi:cell division control protein 7
MKWGRLAQKLNPGLYEPPPGPNGEPIPADDPIRKRHKAFMDEALNLLERCLDLDSTKRITARKALHHPFLSLKPVAPQGSKDSLFPDSRSKKDAEMPSDDDLAPCPPGQGACSDLHWADEASEDGQMWGVQLRGGGTKIVHANDPDARCVGRKPCRYHVGWENWEGVGDED